MAYTPPSYDPGAPRAKGSKLWLWVLVAVVLFCFLMGLGLFFGGRMIWGQVSNTMKCMVTFETAHAALIAYTQEHDGRLPAAATWMQDIEPYYRRLDERMKQQQMPGFMRPTAPGNPLACEGGGTDTGIAFNAELGGKVLADVSDPMTTVLIFEVEAPKMNLAETYRERPAESGPKILGQQRAWINYYVDSAANKDPFQTEGQTKGDFRIDPKDALPPGAPTGSPSPPGASSP